MNNDKILTIQEIVRDVLENYELEISEESRLEDIPEMESVAYMTIISLIETEFGMQFDFDDIAEFKTIGEIVEKLL